MKDNERSSSFSSTDSLVLTDYEEKNKPENQNHIDDIAIDPNLRPDFDITDLNDRDRDEVKDWSNRPYIVTTNWGDVEWRIEAEQTLIRLCRPHGTEHLLEQMEQAKLAAKLDWFERYPYGVRYEIRCLDGNLPDRSTVWGAEGTIESAIRRAKEGPVWQHTITDEQKPSSVRELGMREKDDKQTEGDPSDLYDDDEPATEVEIQAVHWFKIMSDTSVSEADHKAFRRWLAEDEKHQAVYSELRDLWDNQYFELALQEKKNALEKGNMGQVFDRETSVATEERATREDKLATIERKLRRLPSLRVYTAVAACFVLAAFAWVIQLSNPAQLQSQSVPYQTSVGELRSITLSDGSIVNLNTDTQIYVYFSKGYRKVALSRGEAYFDVVKDGRPFMVEGGTGLVKVVGTAFEVRVNNDHMVVLVERGRVAVSSQHDEVRYIDVTPRRQVEVTGYRLGEVQYQPSRTTVADWQDGWLNFKDATLSEVVAELDKYHPGRITVRDTYLSDMRIEGEFDIRVVGKAIKAVALAAQLDYTISSTGNIEFFSPNKNTLEGKPQVTVPKNH